MAQPVHYLRAAGYRRHDDAEAALLDSVAAGEISWADAVNARIMSCRAADGARR